MNDKNYFRTGVLLVNYRQWELTEKCIRSLLADSSADPVIGLVDNGSGQIPPEWIVNHPRIKFLANDNNEGLTAGNNKAFEMVRALGVEYVFILNNDTEVAPGTLGLLSAYLEGHPEAGIAAPAISFASDPDRIWSAGGTYSGATMKLKQRYFHVDELPSEPLEMEQVTGCALMMRAADYKRAGMQDPDLFVYYEDTDLCFRVRKLGWKVILVPDGRVVHHVSISVGGILSPFAVYFTHRNRFIVAARHLKPLTLCVFSAYYLLITMYKTIAYPLGGNGDLVGSMWLGFLHGVSNRPCKRPVRFFPSGDPE